MMDEFKRIDDAIWRFEGASRDELLQYLNSQGEVLIQIALLNLSEIKSHEEAVKVVSMLTEHSSETREYCAFLINRLLKQSPQRKDFQGEYILEKISKAISDVNPKVCRKIIEILPFYTEVDKLFPILINNSESFIGGLAEKNKNKNYQYNTLSFRLYWTTFAIAYVLNEKLFKNYENRIIELLEKLFEFKEYTLREKAAFLAQKISSIKRIKKVENLIKKCAADENFFVKEIIN